MADLDLRTLDLIVIVLYLAGTAALGLYVARKNDSTEAYFLGSRSFPGWAVGLSILGTSISSLTFLTIPAAAYIIDWRQLASNLMLPFVAIVAVIFFVPIFRQRRITTAYEYLNLRFGATARWFAVVTALAFQFVRLSMVLFLVSIPVNLATGIPIEIVITCMGIFIGFYTILGGIQAVIWTDVIQAIILWIGGIISFIFIFTQLPGGIGQILEIGMANDKFSLGEMRWDLGERTFPTMILLGIFAWLGYYTTDQTVIQRYAAAKSTKAAQFGTALYSTVVVPTWAFFYFIGTSLYVFYSINVDPRVAELQSDQIFPFFILTQLPVGVAGVIIAGLLAAAMSTLDSTINSISTVLTTDVMKPYLIKGKSDAFYLRAAKVVSFVTAGIMILGAIYFNHIPKESMNDINWIAASVLSGVLIGLFMSGIFTTRINNKTIIIALVPAFLLNLYLGLGTRGIVPSGGIHAYWVGPLVNFFFLALAYGLSFFIKEDQGPEKLRGLTVWTRVKGLD